MTNTKEYGTAKVVTLGSDYHDADGKILGRATLTFSNGASESEVTQWLEAMIIIQEAKKTAKPINWEDFG